MGAGGYGGEGKIVLNVARKKVTNSTYSKKKRVFGDSVF